MDIREYLKEKKIVTDGSFGTYYTDKFHDMEMPELSNEKAPERVAEIHSAYIKSGAKLIRTNTFASNTVLMHRNWEDVKENIRKGIKIAKASIEKSKEDVFLAGDIGPIPGNENEEEYKTIVDVFLEEKISILTFETFSELDCIIPAIKKAKEKMNPFIMVQFSINQFGYSNAGLSAKRLIKEASKVEEIDAIGFNCGIGPGHMEQILSSMQIATEKYLIALPNAGYPKVIRNKICFANDPEYFANKIQSLAEKGVDILGGCCGTTPEFIEKITYGIDITQNKRHSINDEVQTETDTVIDAGFYFDEQGKIKTKKLIAVELAPPANADDEKLLDAAWKLKNMNLDIDVLTFPDSPSGRTRIDSVLMAKKVAQETGMCVMPHICCRDKNAIAMRSMLLGAHINSIDNMLIITGDPIPSMARETVKPVFNFDSVGLMKITQDMNQENFAKRPITYGGAINQGRRNLDVEINRVKKKMEAGASFFLTQPVFSIEDAERLKKIKEETGARILCGIMPLISRKNAMFMKNEIAGVNVTEEIVQRYPIDGNKEEGEAVGVSIAREIIEYTEDFVDGYYFSFPFNRVYLLEKILEKIEM